MTYNVSMGTLNPTIPYYISHISIFPGYLYYYLHLCYGFLLINYVSVLAHFLTVIIVCWGGWVLTENTTLFYQPLHLASHKICIIW